MLTVSDVRIKSSQADKVQGLSDQQIQALLDATALTLKGCGLNTRVTGYQAIFDGAHLMLFDWYAANPTFLRSLTQGTLQEAYTTAIPEPILLALRPIRKGGVGVVSRRGGV